VPLSYFEGKIFDAEGKKGGAFGAQLTKNIGM